MVKIPILCYSYFATIKHFQRCSKSWMWVSCFQPCMDVTYPISEQLEPCSLHRRWLTNCSVWPGLQAGFGVPLPKPLPGHWYDGVGGDGDGGYQLVKFKWYSDLHYINEKTDAQEFHRMHPEPRLATKIDMCMQRRPSLEAIILSEMVA